jgi:cytochrome c553
MKVLLPSKSAGAVVVIALAACAESKVPAVNLGAPEIAWHDKNPEQQKGFMAAVVDPQMKGIFVKHSKEYSASFGCATCHGAGAEAIAWKMPNPQLYSLPKENTLEASNEYDEAVTKFMAEDVTPALDKMLNQGHGEKTEVSCFSCHPTE